MVRHDLSAAHERNLDGVRLLFHVGDAPLSAGEGEDCGGRPSTLLEPENPFPVVAARSIPLSPPFSVAGTRVTDVIVRETLYFSYYYY